MPRRYTSVKRSAVKRRPRKKKPGDDPRYLKFIRSLPCFICYRELYLMGLISACVIAGVDFYGTHDDVSTTQQSKTESAHLGLSTSRRGIGQKYPDRESGPLCHEHHEEVHSTGESFWARNGMDRDWIIPELNRVYEAI